MRSALTLLAIVLMATACWSAGLSEDPVLDKPVTLAVKGEALSDIMPMLEKQTGVRLRVSRDIADQKATIFVDDRPLRQVMEGLSTLFGYHWTKKTFSTGDIHELWQDEKSRQRLADQYARAWDDAWRAAIADIELKDKLAAMTKEERDAFRRQLAEGSKADSPQVKSQLEALKWIEDPLIAPTARFFCEMPADVRAMLRPGVKIKYDSLSPESEWVLPEDTAGAILDAFRKGGAGWLSDGEVAKMGLTFSCADAYKAIDITAIFSSTLKTPPSSFSTSSMATWLTYQRVFEHLPSNSLHLPRIADLSGLEKSVSVSAEDIAKETGRASDSGASPRVNRSDILAILHGKLGLQVISDHYSQWSIWKLLGNATALGISEKFDAPSPSVPAYEPRAAWGWDGKLLYMRTKDIWHSDAAEVPNSLLRKWAASYRDRGYLDLYEQAAIAALTCEQFIQLSLNREYLGLRKDMGIRNTDALRLFGLMSDKQQKEALAVGTSVEGFTPEQTKALAALLPGSRAIATIARDGILTSPVGVWADGPPEYRLDKPQDTGPRLSPTSVSVREGSPRNPGMGGVVVQGSFTSGVLLGQPDQVASKDGTQSMNEGKPADITYTMVISSTEGQPLEVGITIPGGEPDKPNAGEPGK